MIILIHVQNTARKTAKEKKKMEDQDFPDDIDDLLYDIDVDGKAYVLFKRSDIYLQFH